MVQFFGSTGPLARGCFSYTAGGREGELAHIGSNREREICFQYFCFEREFLVDTMGCCVLGRGDWHI